MKKYAQNNAETIESAYEYLRSVTTDLLREIAETKGLLRDSDDYLQHMWGCNIQVDKTLPCSCGLGELEEKIQTCLTATELAAASEKGESNG